MNRYKLVLLILFSEGLHNIFSIIIGFYPYSGIYDRSRVPGSSVHGQDSLVLFLFLYVWINLPYRLRHFLQKSIQYIYVLYVKQQF